MRIGQSTDIHPLTEGRDLIIGGVHIPWEKGLNGHSDADVLLHAIIEALIGAMGLGDIGTHFPDNDGRYKGISSMKLLEKAAEMLKENHYQVVNIDSLILIERPKMKPYIAQMRQNIADTLGLEISQVNVKATTGEKMGFIGHEEGAVAQAVVLIEEAE
ncbi:MAG: 2-C-methyl-D-erythritol 2,4-cyclodiphosphate synthase [Erysipelotrichaceae bacterium]|nr:2-C-methyl-D-erythritol 2,4-cyclodiphosphate synthase [Erysipelotrichaceae bacterium]